MKRTYAYILLLFSLVTCLHAQKRPNILWIVVEDQSAHYGCYGEPLVTTPHVDQLAKDGIRFTQAAVTAPVCSAARSALITGMYQTSIGAHQHRSGRGEKKIHLPEHIKLIPEYFQAAGYHTSLGYVEDRKGRLGKSDYNFEWDEAVYDSHTWEDAPQGTPFFSQIMLTGGKMRGGKNFHKHDQPKVDPEQVKLPPYYPEHPEIKKDWAQYLECANLIDSEVGLTLDKLEKAGKLENTVIFFLTDHGVSHARGKQYCYDEGMMIPLIVCQPKAPAAESSQGKQPAAEGSQGKRYLKSGGDSDLLVSHIDITASSMALAGIEIPKHLEAKSFLTPDGKLVTEGRDHLICARDRCDETVERIRAVRDHRYKYIKHGYPERPHLSPNTYKDQKAIYQAIQEWAQAGKLNELQTRILLAKTRAEEELYDLEKDPWELHNLAQDSNYKEILETQRKRLQNWITETGDQGQEPEDPEMYDSDMQLYLDQMQHRWSERIPLIEKNIAQMKAWAAEGK